MSALLALGLCFWAALRLTPRWTPPGGGRVESLAATAVLLPTLGISTVRVLAGVGALRPWELLAAFGCLALIAELTATARGRPAVRAQAALEAAAALPLALGTLAVSLALVTAVGLPIWQWDSLGYHLPFVAYALQAGSLSGVPWALPYIGSYPHGVELWDLGARALLSDDRFLDAAQLPLCLCGAVAIAGLSRLAKASASAAVAAGALWLCLPAVFLQLPSVYVDVASAAFFLLAMFWIASAVSAQAAVLVGLALGLFLNSKPSSPAAVLLLGLAFAVRAWRSDRSSLRRSSLRRSALRRSSLRRSTLRPSVLTLLAAALVLALGAESYVTNAVAHGNPLWPVRFDLGPVHLNGQDSLANLLASGAAAPHLLGSLPSRLLRSWTALDPLPAFDMRIGGFGPLFLLFALPIGLVGAMRRGGVWVVGLLAALATPDPAIARFTLPLPALLLALSAGELGRVRPLWRGVATSWAAALAAVGLWLALPGLTAGIPLREVLGLGRAEKEAALLPPETASSWAALRQVMAPQTTVAVDRSFDLTYLLWRSDLRNRVEIVPASLEGQGLLDWIEGQGIKLLVSGSSNPGGLLARAHPERFAPLFPCGASEPDCELFAVQPLSPSWRELVSQSQPAPELVPAQAAPKAEDPSP